ncbi:hypothetical protein N9N67_02350 [Bacteriovoracaceae bacterium]|nr:hypothetical protein [Bacteriovoracaceae bacterium]
MKNTFLFNPILILLMIILVSCGDPGPIEEAEDGAQIGKVLEINTNDALSEGEVNNLKENCKNLAKVHNDATNLFSGSARYSFDYKSYFKACDVKSEDEMKNDINLKIVRVSDEIYRFSTTSIGEKYYSRNLQTDRNGYFKSYCSQVNYEGKSEGEVEEENVTRYVMDSNDTAIKVESIVCEEDRQDICFKFYDLSKVENSSGGKYEVISEHSIEIEKEDTETRGFVKYHSSSNKIDCDKKRKSEVETLRLKFTKFNN